MTNPSAPNVRSRSPVRVAVVLAAIITLGLLSRRYPLSGILAEHAGDGLYTMAVFFGMALLFGRGRTLYFAVSAFILSVAVECSQLLTWPWLGDLRATEIGRMVLGSGFKWPDMVAYFGGAVAAAITDLCLFRHPFRKS